MKTFYSKALKYTAALLLCTARRAAPGSSTFVRFGRRPLPPRHECGTGPHGRIRHTQRRCDSGNRQPAPLGTRHALPDDARRRDRSQRHQRPAPPDHRQLRLQRRGRFRLDGMFGLFVGIDRANHIIQKVPAMAWTPNAATRSSTKRSCCAAFTGSIRRGSGAKCPCPIRPTRRPRLRANRSTRFTPASRKTSTKPTRNFPTAIRT